jgi:hypothetical protein
MRKNSLNYLLAIAAASVMVSPIFAGPVTKIITLTEPENLAGTQLKQGDYKFKIEGNTVTVSLRNKVVATLQGTWTPVDHKWEYDAFITGANGQVSEIRFAGQRQSFMVTGAQQ